MAAIEPPAVRVSVTVTVEMTAEQREAYADRYGVGSVALEARAHLRQSLKAADLGWLDGLATVTMINGEATR